MGAVKTAAKAQLGLKHSRPAGGNPGRFLFGVIRPTKSRKSADEFARARANY